MEGADQRKLGLPEERDSFGMNESGAEGDEREEARREKRKRERERGGIGTSCIASEISSYSISAREGTGAVPFPGYSRIPWSQHRVRATSRRPVPPQGVS